PASLQVSENLPQSSHALSGGCLYFPYAQQLAIPWNHEGVEAGYDAGLAERCLHILATQRYSLGCLLRSHRPRRPRSCLESLARRAPSSILIDGVALPAPAAGVDQDDRPFRPFRPSAAALPP